MHPRLVGFAGLHLGDRGLAEDVAQETLLRVCRDWRKVSRADSPDAWAHRIAVNLMMSWFRRMKIKKAIEDRMVVQHRDGSTLADTVCLRISLDGLPPRQRSALILRFYAQFRFREIAVALDCPEGTAKSLVRRGLETLRKELVDEVSDFRELEQHVSI